MEWILFITVITTGLIAGLFFAWSCSVMPGLARVSDRVFLDAMKSMNRAIQNPLFFSCFFGAALLLPLSAYLYFNAVNPNIFWLLLGATLFYWIGVMGVTIFGNVPLNNRLDAFQTESASEDEVLTIREEFELRWNRLNHIRTVASVAAFVLTITSILLVN